MIRQKISVIVPVFRVEKYLVKCIESILHQTYAKLEIVLVDDGSDDSCPQICDEYAQKYDNIKVVHKENSGLLAAWLDGFKISTGDLIGFVDSDDFIADTMYEKLFESLQENQSDISVCGILYVNEDDLVYDKKDFGCDVYIRGENIDDCLRLILDQTYLFAPCRWNKLYKREIITDSLEKLDKRISYGEDLNLNLFAFERAKKVSCIKDHLYYYLRRGSAITKTKKEHFFSSYIYLIAIMTELFGEKEIFGKDICRYILEAFVLPEIILHIRHNEYGKAQEIMSEKNAKFWLNCKYKNKLRFRKKLTVFLLKRRMFWLTRMLYMVKG